MQNIQILIQHWESKNARALLQEFKQLAQNYSNEEIPLPHPHAISLEGGGQRGRLYLSALETLEKLGFLNNLKFVAGTSVGAIFGLLLGLGFNAKQIREIGEHFCIAELLDARHSRFGDWWAGTWFNKTSSLATEEAMHSGEIFHCWASFFVESILGDPHASFADLHNKVKSGEDPLLKELIFTAVDSKSDFIQEFSFHKTPDVRIVDALHASMTLPGVFPAKIVRNKDGSEFGRFVDGGVRVNNPINILDQTVYAQANYPLQTNSQSKMTGVNPSSLGLSLSKLSELDEAITPISDKVKTEINSFKNEYASYYNLEDAAFGLLKWFHHKMNLFNVKLQHIRTQYWRFYDLGDLFRHIWLFNFGFIVSDKENNELKQREHIPNVVQLWNLDISPHEIQFTESQKVKAEIIGKETVYSWWNKWHKPSETYKGHYVDLKSDHNISQLPVYLNELGAELKKYKDPELKAKGYDEKIKNIRLISLVKKIDQILKSTGKPLTTLKKALSNAELLAEQKDQKIANNRIKRECYLESTARKNAIEAINANDSDKFKRIYYSQTGKGLQFLSKGTTCDSKSILQYIIEQGSPTLLETTLMLASSTIKQSIQNGNQPDIMSVEELLIKACDAQSFLELPKRTNVAFISTLKNHFPNWLSYAINVNAQNRAYKKDILVTFSQLTNENPNRQCDKNLPITANHINHQNKIRKSC